MGYLNKIKEKIGTNQLIAYSIGLLVIIIDQLSKFLITKNMDIATEIILIPEFLSLFYITNSGAAFSALSNQTNLLIVVTLFCIALITNIIQREKYSNKLTKITLGILIGGIIANLIDRILYKNVIDFISVTIFSYKFPIFNIADIGITSGVFGYIVLAIIEDLHAKK